MPIYQYECQKCGHITESLRLYQCRDDPCKCEVCHSSRTLRYAGSFTHQWSIGDGFTETDIKAAALNEGGYKPLDEKSERRAFEQRIKR